MLKQLTREELERAQRRADSKADEAAAETVSALRKFLTNYVRNFKAVLLDTSLKESDLIDLAEQEQIVRTAKELLTESGYNEVVQEFEKSLATVGKEAIEYFRVYFDETATYGGISKRLIDKMAELQIQELGFQVNNKLVRPLETQIRNSTLTLKSRKEAVEDIANAIENGGILRRDGQQFTNYNVETLVAESNRRFMQFVRNEVSEDLGLEVYVYSGPLDSRTSDQCRFLLGGSRHGAPGFWYKDEITTALHPELKANPLVARGHFNCRHEWLPVDEAGAKRIDPSFVPRGGDDG